MHTEPLERARRICLALPEAREKEAWHEPTFRAPVMWMPQFETVEAHRNHVAVLFGFALTWSRWFARGPLEQLLWWATDTARRAIVGRPGPAAAEQASAVRPGAR